MIGLERRREMMATDIVPSDAIIIAKRSDNDAALMDVIYAQGWSKSPKYMTKSEAEAVTEIGNVFNGNTKITDFTAFQYFKQQSFSWTCQLSGMSNLKNIILPNTLTSIGGEPMNNTSVESLVLPNSVTTFVGGRGFRPIKEWKLEEGNTRFAVVNGVLFDKNKTTLLHYPNKDLSEYQVESGVTSIGNNAFYKVKNLSKVILPEGLTTINANAFYMCYDLSEVSIPETVTTIGAEAFYVNNWTVTQPSGELIIPQSVIAIGAFAFRCMPNTIIKYKPEVDIPRFAFYNCSNLTDFVILNVSRVIGLGEKAFTYCDALKNIYVPDELLDEYKVSDVWSTFADRIKPLSEYTE